jgi:L-threonylcarbamoyladenylate synthase
MTRLAAADPSAISRAARRIADGGLVAFPTETVYGLGARADDDAAVAAIFAAKGRPSDHPLIVHLADAAAASHFAADLSPLARRLAAAFWPGPVTVIVERAAGIAEAAAGGRATIGLRCPAHPVARALLNECAALGVAGIAAPSANRFGRVSATCADHVEAEFGADLWVVDGGDCELGIESAVIDCTQLRPALLRPGPLTRSQIEAAIGERLVEPTVDSPRAPGTLAAHYAPLARLRLMNARQLRDALGVLDGLFAGLAVYSRSNLVAAAAARPGILARTMADDPQAVAHELFAVLRDFDAQGARLIWVEEPPADAKWEAVRDRLSRAAAAA